VPSSETCSGARLASAIASCIAAQAKSAFGVIVLSSARLSFSVSGSDQSRASAEGKANPFTVPTSFTGWSESTKGW
jgi:hypothetical protein